jgi:LacI family transcriptional regulator
MERRAGYFRALQEYGIQDHYVVDSLLNRDAAHQATLTLLNTYPHVSALFVVNDNAAMGAISAIRELRCEVPEDISVVGFDDIAYAQDMVPPLTTMHVDKMEMGKLAVRQLLYRIDNKDAPLVTTLMDTSLMVRKSVKALTTIR